MSDIISQKRKELFDKIFALLDEYRSVQIDTSGQINGFNPLTKEMIDKEWVFDSDSKSIQIYVSEDITLTLKYEDIKTLQECFDFYKDIPEEQIALIELLRGI